MASVAGRFLFTGGGGGGMKWNGSARFTVVLVDREEFVFCTFLSENATSEIQKQGKDRKESHQQILKDLENIRQKAHEVWNKIGDAVNNPFSSCLTPLSQSES